MPIVDTTTYEISTRGGIEPDVIDRAVERLGRVGVHCRETITHVELRVTDDAAHPEQRHAKAEATLVVKHGPVRAHAQAETVAEAVDQLIDRLRRRVDRHESKLHRIGTKKHDGVAAAGSWRHGDVVTAPRHAPPVQSQKPEIVRRKTFASAPMTVEEALFDMDILDHNFYLFQELDTRQICLLSSGPDGTFRLAVDGNDQPELPAGPTVSDADGPIVLDVSGAERLLATSEAPFIFCRTSPTSRPSVLYRRFDGNLGMIMLADMVTPSPR